MTLMRRKWSFSVASNGCVDTAHIVLLPLPTMVLFLVLAFAVSTRSSSNVFRIEPREVFYLTVKCSTITGCLPV